VIIYLASREVFISHVNDNVIDDEVLRCFKDATGHGVSAREISSWRESLQRVAGVLQQEGIPKHLGVAVEYRIQNTSKRIDLVLSGRDEKDQPAAVIVELKQWTAVQVTELDGIVRTALGGGVRETAHPSYQAWSYANLLENFNSAVQDRKITLSPCAYLHNCADDQAICDQRYRRYIELAPVFLKRENARLAEFVRKRIVVGDDGATIRLIQEGKSRPSKQLADSLAKMVAGKKEFTLIDEQKVVYERVLAIAAAMKKRDRVVVIVRGGPGTGKSVVAINLLSALTNAGKTVTYVSKNAAPRAVYKSKLTGEITKTRFDGLFRGAGSFLDAKEREAHAVIVDEAHRLTLKSDMYGVKGENQVMELIRASQLSVFFLDEDQRVTLKDIGTEEEIRRWSSKLGATVIAEDLPSQFRCAGSDSYLTWLDDLLEIRPAADAPAGPGDLDFRVFDSPNELHDAVRAANGNNRARVVAGYCWDWVSKKDPDRDDIVINKHGYSAKWNLTSEGSLWIISQTGVEEVGCIHTCQGLEVDTIGVIIGPDLVYRDGRVQINPEARSSQDRTVQGWRKLVTESPEEGRKLLEAVIRNTYRTLMTRGMRSCWVWAWDPGLQALLKERSASATAAQRGSSKSARNSRTTESAL
jgi:uncharacterized protein